MASSASPVSPPIGGPSQTAAASILSTLAWTQGQSLSDAATAAASVALAVPGDGTTAAGGTGCWASSSGSTAAVGDADTKRIARAVALKNGREAAVLSTLNTRCTPIASEVPPCANPQRSRVYAIGQLMLIGKAQCRVERCKSPVGFARCGLIRSSGCYLCKPRFALPIYGAIRLDRPELRRA
jgi:hypothetical protein